MDAFAKYVKETSRMNKELEGKEINIKVVFNPPVIGAKATSATFHHLGEELSIDDYKVKLIRIETMPTDNKVGSCFVRLTSKYGKTTEDICPICKPRGGAREGAGRPKGERSVAVTFRISQDASDKLKAVENKSAYIDNLILNN